MKNTNPSFSNNLKVKDFETALFRKIFRKYELTYLKTLNSNLEN